VKPAALGNYICGPRFFSNTNNLCSLIKTNKIFLRHVSKQLFYKMKIVKSKHNTRLDGGGDDDDDDDDDD
jgi:hypothetical protein